MEANPAALSQLKAADGLEILSALRLGDHVAVWPGDRETGTAGFWLLPADRLDDVVAPRPLIDEPAARNHPASRRAWGIDPLVHVRRMHDASLDQLLPGRSAHSAASTAALRFAGQRIHHGGGGKNTVVVATTLEGGGLRVTQRLTARDGEQALRCRSEVTSTSGQPVTIEALTSLSLGGLSPFAGGPSPRLVVHRFRSHWGAEGRLVSDPLERLHLDRPWAPIWSAAERFGQAGSLPLSGNAPLAGIEDTVAGVTWAVQLHWGGSWQIELTRRDDALSVSCGLADFELGHWRKTLAPGETFCSPEASITAVTGTLDDACARLVAAQEARLTIAPAEDELPIQFNEYGTTWGDPSAARALAIADRLRGTPVRYLVVDSGWYVPPEGDWSRGHGDWVADETRFPGGLTAFADAVRERGLVPGIWMEPETCGPQSAAFEDTARLLWRDGEPLVVGSRRFLDLRRPGASDALGSRVAAIVAAAGIGYVKLDYNASIGLGCDGAESLGEGLRQQVEGSGRFLEALRARAPGLIIECCASGGHRNEPWFLSRVDVASSSDAFEIPEIPVIAANMHRIMPPRQSLVWCVLRAADSGRDLGYKLASTFLGRMCLSGDVTGLSASQWALAERAMSLYASCAPVVRQGRSRRFGPEVLSYRQPEGWQAVVREGTGRAAGQALAVLHTFGGALPAEIAVPLPAGSAWTVTDVLTAGEPGPAVDGGALRITGAGNWAGAVALLRARR